MKIRSIKVRNFKSFKEEKLDIQDFTILVGANASGKSNTISLFRFISNIILYGIDDAISLMGGIDYTVNASIGKNNPIYLKFILDIEDEGYVRVVSKKEGTGLQFKEIECEFEIQPNKRGSGYKIIKDFVKITYKGVAIDKERMDGERYKSLGDDVEYCIEKVKNIFKTERKGGECFKDDLDLIVGVEFVTLLLNEDRKELILNRISILLPPMMEVNSIIKIYDFDPKLLKKSCSVSSVKSLEEDGSNLANVLQQILRNNDSRRKLTNLLSDCLPFIENISVENNFDKSISYKIQEKYNSKAFYANFLSDGTVNILALIVALFFNKNAGIIIIEEPERNLHPKLMEKIVEMAKETAKEKQIILTTHNAEFVKYAEVESLLFSKRLHNGFTKISKPADSDTIKIFLSEELGIEELFLQDMLGD